MASWLPSRRVPALSATSSACRQAESASTEYGRHTFAAVSPHRYHRLLIPMTHSSPIMAASTVAPGYRPPTRHRGLAEMEDKRTSQYATWPMRGRAVPWHSKDVTDRGRSACDMGVGLSSGTRRRCGPGRPCCRSARCATAVWSSPGWAGTPCSMGPAVGGHPRGPWHPCAEQNPTSSRGHGGAGEMPALQSPPLRQDSQTLPRWPIQFGNHGPRVIP